MSAQLKHPKQAMNLPALVAAFSDEDACHAYLAELRWPDGPSCPGRRGEDGTREACGSTKLARLEERRLFECMGCGYQFSAKVGTIFEDSKLPLAKWFLCVFMMAESKKGVSAKQIERMLGVSYKTAWYLCHRVRKAMAEDNPQPLLGIVETDETFVGGKVRIRKGVEALDNKSVVMGAVSRGGQVRLRHVPDRKAASVHGFIDENVSTEAKALYSDEYGVYKSAARRRGVVHGKVNHKREQWVHGQIHTNTIEGVWSLLDRSIIGAYHKVSKKHLHRYLSEVEWRYNNRENTFLFRDTVLELVRAERVEYKALVG